MNITALTTVAVLASILSMPASAQKIIAHRGASYDAPENTLASYKLAFEQGADGIEGDFYLTSDGKIITSHDATTKRTGNVALDIAKSTFDELRKVDVGTWKSPKYAGEKMPTLDEILAIVPPGKMFFIEVKCGPEILPAIDEAIKKSSVKPEQIRLICFKAEVIAASKKLMPQIKTQWLASFKEDKQTGALTPKTDVLDKTLARIKADGFDAQANLKVMTPEYVKQLQARGLEVGFWTVDDPAVAKAAAEMNVMAITTNRPAFIREQLKAGAAGASASGNGAAK